MLKGFVGCEGIGGLEGLAPYVIDACTLGFAALVLGVLACIGITDWKQRIIPNKLIVVLLMLRAMGGFAFMAGWLNPTWTGALAFSELGFQLLAGLMVCGALMLLNILLARIMPTCGIGLGDIKLIFVLVLFIYPEHMMLLLLVSSLCGVVHAIANLIIARDGTFPFGPSLIVGFCLCC